MKVVQRRTGLKADLIRAWERRYCAVDPQRASNGRRLYSDRDVQRLQLLSQAVQCGRRIGDIAGMPLDRLEFLVREDFEADRATGAVRVDPVASETTVDSLIELLRRTDGVGFERALRIAERQRTPQDYLEQLVAPLIQQVGSESRLGTLRYFQEHLGTAVVRIRLGCQLNELQLREPGPCLVLTTPVGQIHELGALMAGVAAAAEGWTVMNLGVSLPAEEIAAAARASDAKGVALSLVHPVDDPGVVSELRRLRQMLPVEIPVLLGGRAARLYAANLTDLPGLRVQDGLSAFRMELRRLR